jgi:hypothetical protein
MKYLVMVVLCLYGSCVAASANLIMLGTEYSTGQSSTTANGETTDNYWTYAAYYNVYKSQFSTNYNHGTYGPAVVSYVPYPSAWKVDSPPAFWVGPSSNQNDNSSKGTVGGNAPGVYVYQLSFSTSKAETVQVSGSIAADNDYEIAYGSSIVGSTIKVAAPGSGATPVGSTINSTTYGFDLNTTTQDYAAPSPFSFTLSVASGTTTLDFLVLNQNTGIDNPTGLYVSDLEVVAVPELPTWAMVLAGLGLVAFGRYCAQRRAKAGPGPGESALPALIS